MAKWLQEVIELHQVFEAYFLGATDSLDRVEQVLGDDFTIVGPDGVESDRATTLAKLAAAHAHTAAFEITISDDALIVETKNIIVARYVENHRLSGRTNHRLATVIFSLDTRMPNGLTWRRVHETWLSS